MSKARMFKKIVQNCSLGKSGIDYDCRCPAGWSIWIDLLWLPLAKVIGTRRASALLFLVFCLLWRRHE